MRAANKTWLIVLFALSPCELIYLWARSKPSGGAGDVTFFLDPIAAIYAIVALVALYALLSNRLKVVMLLLGLAAVLGYFAWQRFAQPLPLVISLKEKWNLLHASARNLSPDAYLVEADINIDEEYNPYPITGYFYSADTPDNFILVGLNDRGEVSDSHWMDTRFSDAGVPKSILLTDWTVDSEEALRIFAKIQLAGKCLTRRPQPGIYMSFYNIAAGYPVWDLDLRSCPNEEAEQHYYLNAQTGEIIDLPQ